MGKFERALKNNKLVPFLKVKVNIFRQKNLIWDIIMRLLTGRNDCQS